MTQAKKFGENRLTIIGTAILFLFLGAGLQSGIFSSREAMEQFLRQTGVLAPLCFLLLQTIQVVIPVVPGGVSCIIGVAMFGPLYGFLLNYAGKYLDMGVNGLISDKPYLVKEVLEDYSFQGIPAGEDYYFS